MKLTKMAGAFALTAAMAMTAVPAFAAAGADNVEQFKTSDVANESTATTKVYAETINAQLNATIPTRVAIVIPSTGPGEVTCPSAGEYKIVNKGDKAIYLKKVTSAGSSLFTLTNVTNVLTTPSTSVTTNTLGLEVAAGAWKIPINGTDQTPTAPVTAPSITANNGELELGMSGRSYVGSTLSASQLESTALSITYTIGTAA